MTIKITKSQLREMIKEARQTISYKDWVPGDDDHHPGYCEDCGCELFSEPDPNDDPEDYQFRLDCESDHYPDYGYDGADHDASGRRYEQVKRTQQGGRKLVQEQAGQEQGRNIKLLQSALKSFEAYKAYARVDRKKAIATKQKTEKILSYLFGVETPLGEITAIEYYDGDVWLEVDRDGLYTVRDVIEELQKTNIQEQTTTITKTQLKKKIQEAVKTVLNEQQPASNSPEMLALDQEELRAIEQFCLQLDNVSKGLRAGAKSGKMNMQMVGQWSQHLDKLANQMRESSKLQK